MKLRYFRVRIKDYRNHTETFEYFDTEKEAKAYCIARSECYIKTLDSYECKDDYNILYQIQVYDRFDGYIPAYYITINGTAFSV